MYKVYFINIFIYKYIFIVIILIYIRQDHIKYGKYKDKNNKKLKFFYDNKKK